MKKPIETSNPRLASIFKGWIIVHKITRWFIVVVFFMFLLWFVYDIIYIGAEAFEKWGNALVIGTIVGGAYIYIRTFEWEKDAEKELEAHSKEHK